MILYAVRRDKKLKWLIFCIDFIIQSGKRIGSEYEIQDRSGYIPQAVRRR